ncbi:sensor domain-containing diguanylate cyclase [Vreelandella hamiltonii]|uniref:Diguanylate cyclase n=1 Tax=Halomonas johnsoniae TaxID=502832 RepID=A0ABQ2WAN4_9GAMM|nr:sensor domain-containing diguanylate cyclase [Halomonas johnsoniae]GGW46333.1 diguanylate cyclase [Halomonas johnsoniae]
MPTPYTSLRRLPLRTRIIGLITALVFTITLLLSWVASREAAFHLEHQIGDASANTAYQMADKLSRSMDARIKEVQLLLGIRDAMGNPDAPLTRLQLEQLQRNYEVTSWIGVTDAEGIVVAATGGILEGQSIAARPVFMEGRQALWIGDVHEAVLLAQLLPNPSGEPIKFVDIAAPLLNRQDQLLGVLAVHLSWDWAAQVKASMFTPALREQQTELLLLSEEGSVILGPSDLLGETLTFASASGTMSSATWDIETWPDGEDYMTGMAPSQAFGAFPGLGWIAISRQPVDTAFAPVARVQELILGAGLLMALMFSIIGWIFAARLVAPLTRLARSADHIQTAQSRCAIEIETGSPELERLSTSIRKMVERLQDQRQTINQLADLVNTDPLTGLPNRAFLNQYLQHAQPEAQRQQQNLIMLMFDLDGFKNINDTLGHHAGDLLLIEITQRLKTTLRSGDVIARLGGDEFLMVIKSTPENSHSLAEEVSQRLLTQIALPIELPGNMTAQVGCSLGAAVWPEHGMDIQQVIRHADNALYQAKHQGKHRLVIYRPGV